MGGAVLVALLAILVEVAFQLLQRAVAPVKEGRTAAVVDEQVDAAPVVVGSGAVR